ncbi:Peptidyl-prolyl cis-trans isomerase [Pseudoloma neurophilia]|uniref:Peptidyl-prolyl cis-trans isomerase n=1 Tax=Pseudoloma neurophilia TaxID=146866 RepID=A0A0R0LTF5_9MICR|nr:Peptidyl-prolyl cis-trans isomerase [Pseudoloma neurophilia]
MRLMVFLLSIFASRQVYMDVEFTNEKGNKITRKLIFDLFDDVEKTVNNFCGFINGVEVNGKKRSYENTIFHRVIEGFMIQGGDILNGNGTGSISIYDGKPFADENFKHLHMIGSLAMANSGPNSNGSQFYITVGKTQWLDKKHVVFGQITKETFPYVQEISRVVTNKRNDKPVHPVKIVKCGDYLKSTEVPREEEPKETL